jgi:proline dehydrogenase
MKEKNCLEDNCVIYLADSDVRTGIEGLAEALDEYEESYELMQNTKKNVDSVQSHKLVQLNFSVKNRFYHRIISKLVSRFIAERLRKLESWKSIKIQMAVFMEVYLKNTRFQI